MTTAPIAAPGLFYPFAVGLVAVVNPCGFPLLPAYLGLAIEQPPGAREAPGRRAERALLAGLCATIGFLVVFGIIGILVEVGLAAFYGHAALVARWVMAATGVGMLAVGVAACAAGRFASGHPSCASVLGSADPSRSFVFGVSYGIASLGCAWPLFLSGVATTFTRSSFGQGLAAFAAYALGMGIFLAALALVVVLFGPAATRRMRVVTRFIPLLGAVLLVVVGAYLTLYWTTAIINPTGSSWPLRLVQSVQERISGAVVADEVVIGAALGAVIVAALVLVGLSGAGAKPHDTSTGDDSSNAASVDRPEAFESPARVDAR